MNPPLLTLLALALCACSVGPTVKYPDGRIVSLGGSLLEKSTDETALIVLPDGTQLAYRKTGKDQTDVARMAIGTWGTVASIKEMAAGLNDGEAIRETNQTRRVVSDNSVKKAGIQSQTAIQTFVPPQP